MLIHFGLNRVTDLVEQELQITSLHKFYSSREKLQGSVSAHSITLTFDAFGFTFYWVISRRYTDDDEFLPHCWRLEANIFCYIVNMSHVEINLKSNVQAKMNKHAIFIRALEKSTGILFQQILTSWRDLRTRPMSHSGLLPALIGLASFPFHVCVHLPIWLKFYGHSPDLRSVVNLKRHRTVLSYNIWQIALIGYWYQKRDSSGAFSIAQCKTVAMTMCIDKRSPTAQSTQSGSYTGYMAAENADEVVFFPPIFNFSAIR